MTHFSSNPDFTFETLAQLKKDPTINLKTVSNDMYEGAKSGKLDFSPKSKEPSPKTKIIQDPYNINTKETKLSTTMIKQLQNDDHLKTVSGFSIARTEASTQQHALDSKAIDKAVVSLKIDSLVPKALFKDSASSSDQ